MQRLKIKKLIVVSLTEKTSREISFEDGLNIMLGGNKTGKSSLIKQIFWTLGCELKSIESDWKKLISYSALLFQYGQKEYCITRDQDTFGIYQVEDESYFCIMRTTHFHEYNDALMDTFQINIPCINIHENVQIRMTTPLLFRFQYIDQDNGWNRIGDSFANAGYIKNWKGISNKYVVGYLPDQYYEALAEHTQMGIELTKQKESLSTNKQFVLGLESIDSTISNEIYSDPDSLESDIEHWLSDLSAQKVLMFDAEQKLMQAENTLHINKSKLSLVKKQMHELHKDIEFALDSDTTIVCPMCGNIYENGLVEQLQLSEGLSFAESLSQTYSDNILKEQAIIDNLSKELSEANAKIALLQSRIDEARRVFSYIDHYKISGKKEVYAACQKLLLASRNDIDQRLIALDAMNDKLKEFKSSKHANEIKKLLTEKCSKIASIINIPNNYIKLKDFVQEINKTGSETPRLVYMYHTALYLYNVQRAESPFNFLIVDTPNQQGQDDMNLSGIFSTLRLLDSKKGQFIVCSERETGYEDQASNVITLNVKRRCLEEDRYDEHLGFFKDLLLLKEHHSING